MTRTNTFSILFWLKLASAKNRKAPLYARITVNGKRSELSLKRKVCIPDWDTAKSRLKAVSDENKLINGYLEQVYVKLFECSQQLENKNKLVTSDIIKAHFLGNTEIRHSLSDIG